MKESEYKLLIEKECFLETMQNLYKISNSPVKELIQINYFFDSPDMKLFKHHMTFRIRQTEQRLNLQLKETILDEGIHRLKEEYSIPIAALTHSYVVHGLFSDPIKVELSGVTVTCRTIFLYSDGLQIHLDKNMYLGKEDYELEIEYPEGKSEEAFHILRQLIPLENYEVNGGKKHRFFHALNTSKERRECIEINRGSEICVIKTTPHSSCCL